jgi:hypothetical protein
MLWCALSPIYNSKYCVLCKDDKLEAISNGLQYLTLASQNILGFIRTVELEMCTVLPRASFFKSFTIKSVKQFSQYVAEKDSSSLPF